MKNPLRLIWMISPSLILASVEAPRYSASNLLWGLINFLRSSSYSAIKLERVRKLGRQSKPSEHLGRWSRSQIEPQWWEQASHWEHRRAKWSSWYPWSHCPLMSASNSTAWPKSKTNIAVVSRLHQGGQTTKVTIATAIAKKIGKGGMEKLKDQQNRVRAQFQRRQHFPTPSKWFSR